jgi:hypothetical protein
MFWRQWYIFKIIKKIGLVVDLKLVQLGGRGESDLDILGFGVAGETSAAEVWSVLPSVSEDSPSPQILAILTDFLALSLQYPHNDMRSAASQRI